MLLFGRLDPVRLAFATLRQRERQQKDVHRDGSQNHDFALALEIRVVSPHFEQL